MPLYKSITVPSGLLSVWRITESSGELLSFFTPEEIAHPNFQKFTYEKRKVEWLAIRALLKQMIGADFEISYSESGKPILSHPDYRFISISHSRDYAAVYIHRQHSVGIDIENTTRNYAAVKHRYLSETELKQVSESTVLQCLYWCAKEAIFKLVEEEGVDFRKQIEVIDFNPEQERFFARFISGSYNRTYQLQHSTFDHHCMVWVCSDSAR